MNTDEQRVRSLTRREVSVIYLTCKDKSLKEIALEIGRSLKLVSHYRTKAYKKLDLAKYPDEEKVTYLKKFYCPILSDIVKAPKDIENWIPIDIEMGTALLIVDVEAIEDEEEEELGLIVREKTEIIDPTPKPEPRRSRPWWIILVLALIGVIIYLWLRPPQPPEVVVETVIVTQPPATQVAQIIPSDTIEPANTPLPSDTPAPTSSPTPAVLTVSSTLRDDRVSLEMLDSSFNRSFDVYSRYALGMVFEFKNINAGQILLRLKALEVFKLQDNIGREYECAIRFVPQREDISRDMNTGDAYKFNVGCGPKIAFDSEVDKLTLSMDQFSSLPPSEWIIDVPK